MDLKEMKEGVKKGVREAEGQDVLLSRTDGTLALTTNQMELKTMCTCTRMPSESSRWVFAKVLPRLAGLLCFHFSSTTFQICLRLICIAYLIKPTMRVSGVRQPQIMSRPRVRSWQWGGEGCLELRREGM